MTEPDLSCDDAYQPTFRDRNSEPTERLLDYAYRIHRQVEFRLSHPQFERASQKTTNQIAQAVIDSGVY